MLSPRHENAAKVYEKTIPAAVSPPTAGESAFKKPFFTDFTPFFNTDYNTILARI